MMPRLIYITLYILPYIFFANGQDVQLQRPYDACVPQLISLRCPSNYVIVVTSAFYGVPQQAGACYYTPGDCIGDAMSITTVCNNDNVVCALYAVKKKLPLCNDQFGSYIHVEYDCVPISMEDSTKEYNVCQNGTEITSDHGIIKSPNYPSQFQTTTNECFRAIHVPNDKTIRLWISDLYIGSAGINCANDHVFVVDSVQTYKFCGSKRYAYPYLCSSTILIQYKATTQFSFYKGLRMYFDIIDRPTNDNCPSQNVTLTPAPGSTTTITSIDPDVTTTTPSYVGLGIASPVLSFQLCKGESYNLECPNNYGVAVVTNIFGVTQSNLCEPHDAVKHCVVTTEPIFFCRQRCTYLYLGNRVVQTCNNKTAAYQYVEYQCIPTKATIISPNTTCPTDGSITSIQFDRNGRFQSFSYPQLKKMDCTYRFKTTPGYIMHVYSIDISINDFSKECQPNNMSLIDNGKDGEVQVFCELRTIALLYSSCSNELDLRYTIGNDILPFSYGVELYIEHQARPSDWTCGQPLLTTMPATIRTTPFTTPTATPITSDSIMSVLDEVEYDICWGGFLSRSCPTGYTFMIIGGYYGVKKQESNKCGFTQGDCVQEAGTTITQCRNDATGCYLPYANKRRLAHCSDKYADYLHVTYQCVPSRPVGIGSSLQTYDICDTNNPILNFNGVVISPGFPRFQQRPNECKRTISDVQDRVLKIWINEMVMPSGGQRSLDDDSNEADVIIHKKHITNNSDDLEQMYPAIRDTCVKDYLIIDTPHVSYVYCGTRKLAMGPICATNIVIKYKATSQPNSFLKGFKFYFEWVEKPLDIFCGGLPNNISTTTPINEPIPIWAQNLELSPMLSVHVCLGTSTTIRCPRSTDYVLAIFDSSYGVTGTGLCEVPSNSHCFEEASLSLTCTQSCFIEYIIPKPLAQCKYENGDYLNIDYECIPTRLPNHENPIDICASTTTDTIAIDSGMMISPQYPTLGAARKCSKTIETVKSKLWVIYLVDVFLEGENAAGDCDKASLVIFDGYDTVIRCGLHQPELVYISCSNVVEFSFTSTQEALGYRGFKVYFKTIDVPDNWGCIPSGFSTITPKPTTRPPITTTLIPPSLQIVAYGGTTNNTRQYCKFPFIYQGNQQSNCLRIDPPGSTSPPATIEPWCSLTSNFDLDGQWGFCELGITGSTIYDICVGQSQMLSCPPNYVIDIITADYAAKPNGNINTNACVHEDNDCFQSDSSTIRTACAGQPSCTVTHVIKTLVSCHSQSSAYLHVDYTCIPNSIQDITTYNMCNNNSVLQGDVRRGYIVSPNYPNPQNNIDCTFNLQTSKPRQDIYLYVLDMDLNSPNLLGQSCSKDRLIVRADNCERELCGGSYTDFLLNTCHTSVSLQLIRASDAQGRGVKFYFEFRERLPQQTCALLATTTSSGSTSSSIPTTTYILQPSYFPDPSPRMLKTLCYPDISCSYGANNFVCPRDYIIVIHRAFYGKGNRCDYTPGDCTTEADTVYRTCSGRQACSVSYINPVMLPECNQATANYLFVEYQCLPTPPIAQNNGDLCTGQIDQSSAMSGVLKSPSYPSYAQKQCENVTLSSIDGSNLVIYMYLLDLNIGSPDIHTRECSNDYLSISYQCYGQLYTSRLCGTRSAEILFSTCTSTDKIFASYNLLNVDAQSQRGFALLYHLLPKVDPPTTTRLTTTPRITTITTMPGPGPLSTPTESSVSCVQKMLVLQCKTPNYALILHKVQLTVSASRNCTYSPNDCFEDRIHLYNSCGGLTSCNIFPQLLTISACNNSRTNYLYTEHQCVPTRPKLNLDVCSSTKPFERVEGGARISSLNYTAMTQQCKIQLQSNRLLGAQTHKAFRIYILTLNLPFRSTARGQGSQCNDNDPFIEIDDSESDVTRLCGNSHSRYLLETCSDIVEIRYHNVNMSTGVTKYKGFEIYFESIENEKCRPTLPPPLPTPALEIKKEIVCASANGRDRVNFGCTPDHGLVFLQSYKFVTEQPNKCDLSQHICHSPSEQPEAQCSGQQTCSYVQTIQIGPQLNICQNKPSDSVEFYYQCLPMRRSTDYETFTFCTHTKVTSNLGFIETLGFPNSYEQGRKQCSMNIPLPVNNAATQYSVYLYIIELSIYDTSASTIGECYDSVKYSDGDLVHSMCGNIDQPSLKYTTDKKELNLILNMSAIAPSEWNNWRGARFFFFIGEQSLPSAPGSLITTPTPTPTPQTSTSTSTSASTSTTDTSTSSKPPVVEPDTKPPTKPNHGGLIAGIIVGVLILLLAIIGFVFYRRRSLSKSGETHRVSYKHGEDGVDGTLINGASPKRSSIPSASLKGPAPSAFVSPFFNQSDTTGKQGMENAADA